MRRNMKPEYQKPIVQVYVVEERNLVTDYWEMRVPRPGDPVIFTSALDSNPRYALFLAMAHCRDLIRLGHDPSRIRVRRYGPTDKPVWFSEEEGEES